MLTHLNPVTTTHEETRTFPDGQDKKKKKDNRESKRQYFPSFTLSHSTGVNCQGSLTGCSPMTAVSLAYMSTIVWITSSVCAIWTFWFSQW